MFLFKDNGLTWDHIMWILPDLQSLPYLPGSHISHAVPWNPSLHRHSPLPQMPSWHLPLLEHQLSTFPGHLKQSRPKYPGQQEWSLENKTHIPIYDVEDYINKNCSPHYWLVISIAVMHTLHDEDLTLIFFIQSIMQPGTDFLLTPTLVLYLQLDFIFRGNASFTFKMEYMCMLIKFHSG